MQLPSDPAGCLNCELETLEKLEQFYEKEPTVKKKLHVGREKLFNKAAQRLLDEGRQAVDRASEAIETILQNYRARIYLLAGDTKRAFELYELTAEKKDKVAQFWLSFFYWHGTYVKKNVEKALELLNASAEQEYGPAQYELAALLAESSGHEAKIRSLYERAVENGYLSAYADLGQCYAYGHFGKVNPQKAVELFQFAADKGDANAQQQLGRCYVLGIGVAINKKTGLDYMHKAADQGHSEAMHDLAVIFHDEDNNSARRLEYLEKAAQLGNPNSQLLLGRLYANGLDVEKDEKLAFHYCQLAARQGLPGAYYGLGFLFENTDAARAISYYTVSARMGFQDAIVRLSELGISYEPAKDRFVQTAQ